MDRLELMQVLKVQNIQFDIVEHPPAMTIEEIDSFNLPHGETIVKNLFLRDDKKKNYYLVVLCKNKTVNLKEFCKLLDSRPLTFASENDLQFYLGLKKGSVTPFGVLNDVSGKVCLVMDQDVLAYSVIGVHPNENTATLWLSPDDLKMLVERHGNPVRILTI